nr:protein diaphanous homolog 2-like [Aegilops tauschii subsp. strangulata]
MAPSSSSLARSIAILALICSALACSTAAQVAQGGSREPGRPPSPQFPSPRRPGQAPLTPPPPPSPKKMRALPPHRKTLQVAGA